MGSEQCMSKKSSGLSWFENPPLEEVVVDMQFTDLEGLDSIHISEIYEALGKEQSFPERSVQPPLHKPTSSPGVFISNVPEMPRYWFTSKDKKSLVQIQPDRFIYNWRKKRKKKPYTRFEEVFKEFDKYHSAFISGLKKSYKRLPEYEALRLTYINFVPISDFGTQIADISKLFKGFDFNSNWPNKPKNIRHVFFYDVEELKSEMRIIIDSVLRNDDATPAIRFEIQIGGSVIDGDKPPFKKWYMEARKKINCTFKEMTQPGMHKIWKLKEAENE